jgi:Zn-dependent peptidase ImmA (M78 family)
MANIQVTLRQRVRLNLLPGELKRYGLAPDANHIVDLPAGLVDIPEELAAHWYVAKCIEAGKKPLMGLVKPAPEPVKEPEAKAEDTIKSPEELEKLSDDDLRKYLRAVGNQVVANDATREKVLARIDKLRKVD